MTRVIKIEKTGGPEVLKLETINLEILASLSENFPLAHQKTMLSLLRFSASHLRRDSLSNQLEKRHAFPDQPLENKPVWLAISRLLLNKKMQWRQAIDKRIGFPAENHATNKEEKKQYRENKEKMNLRKWNKMKNIIVEIIIIMLT